MDFFDPNIIDKRPKRRKDKCNPYKIFTIGINSNYPRYFVHIIADDEILEINEDIYQLLNQFELEDLSYINEQQRHYEFSESSNEYLYSKKAEPDQTLDNTIQKLLDAQQLHIAIQKLPKIQQKRLKMYYFGGFTLLQIAIKEGCSKVAVKYSIDAAISNLKKILKTQQ